jgi:hypothetical protein
MNIYGNDSWVESAGGSFTIMDKKNNSVQMVTENIKIDLFDDYYEMDIIFKFFNSGETVDLNIGFPEYSYGTGTITNINNFHTSINDNIVDFEILPENNTGSKIKRWYVKNVIFPHNEYLESRVKYQADYSNRGYDRSVEYLYGTGCTWKDAINSIIISITNHTVTWINKIEFETGYWDSISRKKMEERYFPVNLERKDGEKIEITVNNIVPYKDDTFLLIFSDYPLFDPPPFTVSERRWILRNKIFTNTELVLLSNEQLRLLRNSIYAYHGYMFKAIDLQEYFNNQPWYKINEEFSEILFTTNERINLNNIINEENRRK